MKHASGGLTGAAVLVLSLAACGGGDNKAAPPSSTGGSSPSTTATSQPATTTPTPVPTGTKAGPAELAAHSTYTYGGLKVVVNLPADIPSASRPSLRLFSDFLQRVGRTTAQNKVDPSLPGLASADVGKYVRTFIQKTSVRTIGSVIYTISNVHTVTPGPTQITGCLDQSKLVQVLKDGSHLVDAGTKKYPTLKMTAETSPGMTGPKVTTFTFAAGTC